MFDKIGKLKINGVKKIVDKLNVEKRKSKLKFKNN